MAMDATAIMDQVNNRYVGDDAVSKLDLAYKPKKGAEKSMQMTVYALEKGEESKTLLKFISPSFMRDSGLLVHSFDDKENLQWIFLSRAAKREPRKITSAEKGKPLFGTDIYYVDIEKKSTPEFSYQFIENSQIDDRKVAIIEARPKTASYPYDMTRSWVDVDRKIELKIDYSRSGKIIKTLQVENVELIEDIWTVTRAVVTSHEEGSVTVMKVSDLDYNSGLSDEQFGFKALTQRGR